MFAAPLILSLLAGCPTEDEPVPVDLTERLAAGEVRAGVVTDEAALFGGISAEGRGGDVKIYNDRVQFVIQGFGPGNYWATQPGTVVDADIVRPDGQVGRDLVDEWITFYGIGRLVDTQTIAVIENGRTTGRAVVRVEGPEVPFDYITGIIEDPHFLADLGLRVVTDYILEPDSWLLEVRSTVTATDQVARFEPGDVLFGSLEAADLWEPGPGLKGPAEGDKDWVAYAGKRNDVAVGMFPVAGESFAAGGYQLLGFLMELAAGAGGTRELAVGESLSWVRYYGVGPDVATLSDAWLERTGVATDEVAGVVTAPDGPVAGARVAVVVDGEPYTLAVTGEDGAFSALVPAGSETSVLAEGRGPALFTDLPPGAAPYSSYAAEVVREQVLSSIGDGAVPVPLAQGRGVGSEQEPLVLGEPSRLVVRSDDGLPFEVRVRFTQGDPGVDRQLVPGRPSGHAALGWARDGEVVLEVEPGTYDVLVHRGPRHGYARQTVEVSGEAELEVSLPLEVEHPGWIHADPHIHASPSPDGHITMEDRLVVCAAHGLQVHFGTDHDHAADYRPLLEPLGLEGVLASVVADEVSPVIRGHLNVYPLEYLDDQSNGGAWPWYSDLVPDTQTEFDILHQRHPGVIVQANHPVSPGLASAAGWSPGYISRPDNWSEDFDAVEVMNGGGTDALEFYLDLVNRGVLVTPTGVSDSHSHLGATGFSSTYIGIGTDDPAGYTDELLREAMAARRTVVSRGPFLELSVPPGSEVVGSTELEVQVHSSSWVLVDRVLLLRDGEVVETVEGTSAAFQLEPDEDAAYIVIAEGDSPMSPVSGSRPWAMSSAILVDVAGDGWESPLPPLILNE